MALRYIEETWTEGDNTTVQATAVDLDGTTTLGDLSSATVELIYWFEGRPPAKLTGSGTAASVISAKFNTAGGAANGVPDHGTLHFIWRVNDGTDTFHSVNEWVVQVRAQILQAAA